MYDMASLFGKNKLREIANKLQTSELENEIALVKTWHNDYHNGSLKSDKETSREQAYNQDFFIKILGYKEKPAVPYSFEPKATTDKGQLPDAVLSHTDASNDIKSIAAVVELKGASIALDRPQRREGNMSPVQQGFKYKTQYRNCPFVVVSNFWEFRLYHDNQLDYELWTLDDLVDPADDYLKFKTFYTLLHSDNLTTPKGASKTEGWLSDIRFEQEEISKKFYKVYREARLELLRDIYQHNEIVRTDINLGIEKAQKIIDRIVFACFAEDRGLLPDDTLRRVVQAADNSTFGGSLWFTFKAFFEAIDVGSEKLEIPDGYNGGLFAYDKELNALNISDEPLRKVASISNYNFVEDLSVTILGHIFEQSISDLEEIKSKVVDSNDIASLQQSRRKKDGIFYTPDYIVRYIVDNSLGAYLRDEEERLKTEFKLKGDITDKSYEKRERQAYGQYQDFLQNVKVVDPACGSGAFLVYVFDYLLAENQRVASILGNNLFSSEDYVKSILKNNIYGVDLNDESVEITKLSLWLKSAQKGKKLTTLDSNIKCGNSLVDDPDIAGTKAFDWNKEFADVFKQGGFDVIIGNPPYGVSFDSDEKNYLLKFDSLVPDFEAYIYFISLVKKLLKPHGILSYIFPNTFLSTLYGVKYRKHLFDNFTVYDLVNLSNDPTFSDASVRTVVMSVQNKTSNYQTKLSSIISDKNIEYVADVSKKELLDSVDNLLSLFNLDKNSGKVVKKIRDMSKPMSSYFTISQGYIPYRRSDLIKQFGELEGNRIVDNREWHSSIKLSADYVPEVAGKELYRYSLTPSYGSYIKYGKHVASYVDPKFFVSPRILIREITADRLYAAYTELELYNNPSIINSIPKDSEVNPKAVLAIVNSKLIGWYHNVTSPKANKGLFPKILINDVRNLPIVAVSNPKQLADYADEMQQLNEQLLTKNSHFIELIKGEIGIEKVPTKLSKWWLLDFPSFIKLLRVSLSLQQKDELLQLFSKYKKECSEIDISIQKIDHDIDQLVYHLYELSPEEIKIVESQTK